MIENDLQYDVTWSSMMKLMDSLDRLDPGDVYYKLYEASLQGQIADLRRELEEYQSKKTGM